MFYLQQYLDFDVTLPVDKVQSTADFVVQQLNAVTARLKKIFLVEDLIDSLKFAGGKAEKYVADDGGKVPDARWVVPDARWMGKVRLVLIRLVSKFGFHKNGGFDALDSALGPRPM